MPHCGERTPIRKETDSTGKLDTASGCAVAPAYGRLRQDGGGHKDPARKNERDRERELVVNVDFLLWTVLLKSHEDVKVRESF